MPETKRHLELVDAVVRQLEASIGTVLPREDMVSLGRRGLLDAISRFDPSRGASFSSRATSVAPSFAGRQTGHPIPGIQGVIVMVASGPDGAFAIVTTSEPFSNSQSPHETV